MLELQNVILTRARAHTHTHTHTKVQLISGIPKGGVWGVQTPPRNSEDIGGVLEHMSKKNRRLDFLL